MIRDDAAVRARDHTGAGHLAAAVVQLHDRLDVHDRGLDPGSDLDDALLEAASSAADRRARPRARRRAQRAEGDEGEVRLRAPYRRWRAASASELAPSSAGAERRRRAGSGASQIAPVTATPAAPAARAAAAPRASIPPWASTGSGPAAAAASAAESERGPLGRLREAERRSGRAGRSRPRARRAPRRRRGSRRRSARPRGSRRRATAGGAAPPPRWTPSAPAASATSSRRFTSTRTSRPRGGVARRCGDRVDQPEQRGVLEPALAHLDPVDAAAHGRRYPRWCRFRRLAAIHHEAQDRASHCAQKLAVPSSGLDAEAYSRRGIRPDS